MRALALSALVVLALGPATAEANAGAPDAAFAVLQRSARQARSSRVTVEVARERTARSLLPRGHVASDARLFFDGKRARIQLTVETRIGSGAPRRETHLIRVPLGRLLGWYGRSLVRGQFPGLTPEQVSRALK